MFVARYAATVVVVAGLAAGCASHSVRTPSVTEMTTGTSASGVVTADELARTGREGSLMDALSRLRPFMLVSRGTTAPRVSVDGAPLAELSLLRTMPASLVREVRLQRASSSAGRPTVGATGEVIVGDVIVVTTWQGGRLER